MKNKYVYVVLLIFSLIIYILGIKLNHLKEENRGLESEIRTFERQIELNKKDLIKKTEEVKNAYILQKKAEAIKGSPCLNSVVDSDFAKLLYDNEL